MATLVSRNEFNVYESADARFEAAARKLNLTAKALRSRVERGSVPGARRVGKRWHVPLSAAAGEDA